MTANPLVSDPGRANQDPHSTLLCVSQKQGLRIWGNPNLIDSCILEDTQTRACPAEGPLEGTNQTLDPTLLVKPYSLKSNEALKAQALSPKPLIFGSPIVGMISSSPEPKPTALLVLQAHGYLLKRV